MRTTADPVPTDIALPVFGQTRATGEVAYAFGQAWSLWEDANPAYSLVADTTPLLPSRRYGWDAPDLEAFQFELKSDEVAFVAAALAAEAQAEKERLQRIRLEYCFSLEPRNWKITVFGHSCSITLHYRSNHETGEQRRPRPADAHTS